MHYIQCGLDTSKQRRPLGELGERGKILYENERLRACCQELQITMTGNPTGNGKNRTQSDSIRLHTDINRLNIKQVNVGIKKYLLPVCKILPTKFHKFSKNKKRVRQRILKWVAILAETNESDYWNQIIVSAVNNK